MNATVDNGADAASGREMHSSLWPDIALGSAAVLLVLTVKSGLVFYVLGLLNRFRLFSTGTTLRILAIACAGLVLLRLGLYANRATGTGLMRSGVRMGLCLLVVTALVAGGRKDVSPEVAFTYGFRQRIIHTADIEAIRRWAATIEETPWPYVDPAHWPACVRDLAPDGVYILPGGHGVDLFYMGETRNQHWGLAVGVNNVSQIASHEMWYVRRIVPGVYVWLED